MDTEVSNGLHEAFDAAVLERHTTEFHHDGITLVRGVLGRDECADLRERTEALLKRPEIQESLKHGYSFVISNPLLHDRAFAELFGREPILGLVRAVLGAQARFCGQSVICNKPGEAVAFWHLDDHNRPEMPLPDDVPRWPAGARMPVHWLSVQIALSDILTLDDGPTEVVRGSHYSGRVPVNQDEPVFEGRGPEQLFVEAGDIYLFNHQIWHRGRPRTSEGTRYLLQLQYARGDNLSFRMQGAPVNDNLHGWLEGASDDLRRVLVDPPQYV